ncbi:phage tail fiber protein [Proteus mirabilis]|uniref:phage tail fiber protein n=1 Tax=Proteus mirabilis TaxID=584 RepID=UPI004068DC5D
MLMKKTYHGIHPNAPKFARNDIDGYKEGDPIDIPDDHFISVRVQMPEQSIYNVRIREMEEAQKVEEEGRQKEEKMKEQ